MIDFDRVVPLRNKRNLPSAPGIYFVAQENDDQIIYIGQTKNLQDRWRIHHRLREFKACAVSLKIYWIIAPAAKLPEIEREYINKLHPKMNQNIGSDFTERTSFNLTRAQILALDSLALAVGCINQNRVSEQPIANKTDLIRLIADNANDARLIEVLKTIKRSDQNAKTIK